MTTTRLPSFDGVAVAIGAVTVFFLEDAEISLGSGGTCGAHGDGHDKQGFGAFHDVDHLMSGGYFDPVFYGILLNDYSVVEVVLDGVNLFATKFSTHFF